MSDHEQESGMPKFSVGDIYYVLFRHKWLILLLTALGVGAAVAIYVRTPAVYRSEAKLLVRYITESTTFDPDAKGGRSSVPLRVDENVINSEVEILLSRDLVESVVDEIGPRLSLMPTTNSEDRLMAAMGIMRSLQVDAPKRTTIIRVSYDAPNPVLAQEVLQRLVLRYLERHNEIHRSVGAFEFLSQQTDQIRSRLAQTEEDLRRIKSEAGVVSIDETKAQLSDRFRTLQQALQEAEASLAGSRARASTLLAQMGPREGGASAASSNAPPHRTATERDMALLNSMTARERELLATYSEGSAPVREVRARIAEMRRMMDLADINPAPTNVVANSEADTYANARDYMQEQASIASLEARLAVLKEQLTQAARDVQRADEIESRVSELRRRKEIQEANYKYFAESLEQARIDDALNARKISNISVVQPATYPAQATRPNLPRNIGIVLALGIFGGLGLAFVREFLFDHSLKRSVDVEASVGAPTLISIPRMKEWSAAPLVDGRPAMALLGPAGAAGGSGDGRDDAADYYEALRDRVLLAIENSPRRPYILGVTGCKPDSGVSTVAAGLALSLARGSSDRVLMVDGNPEHRSTRRVLGVDPKGGFIEITGDGHGNAAVVETNVFLVPAADGSVPPPAGGAAQKFLELLGRLRESATTYVVVDLPPVTETSLTLRIARFIDGIVLVVEAEKVDRDMAERARHLLAQSNGMIIGSVLNKQRRYVPNWLKPYG